MLIEVPERLEATTVRLRPLRAADAEPYADAFVADSELGRLLGFERDPTVDSLRARWGEGAMDAGTAERAAVELAIAGREQGEFLGTVLLHSLHERHRRAEIGFWLIPTARRRGLGHEAVTCALAWCFGPLDLLRVEMTTTPDNTPTRAFARRLGFTEEGLQRKRAVERGQRVDFVMFGLLREDWPPPVPPGS
jgi:RimJ/RimL family protein N-acetyltransferase